MRRYREVLYILAVLAAILAFTAWEQNQSCDFYGGYQTRNVPVRCLGYFAGERR